MNVFGEQLVQAMQDGNTLVAEKLVAKLSDVNAQSLSRHTALHSAVFYGDLAVAGLLMQRGANMMLMPRNRNYDNKHECALMMALKMGEGRADMQLLLVRALHAQRTQLEHAGAWSPSDLFKIHAVPHYAMLYSTPEVFSGAIQHDGDANARNVDNMTAYMHTIREVANFERDVDVCRVKMARVTELVESYPEMLWARYNRADVQTKRPFLSATTSITGLGMLIFECITGRCERLAVDLAQCEDGVRHPTMYSTTGALQQRIEAHTDVIRFFKFEFIPHIFVCMMQPMFLALGMATHTRLGSRHKCHARALQSDNCNMVFNVFMLSLTTADMQHMLC